jgi:hypothetical protein
MLRNFKTRALAPTIWAPGAIPVDDLKYRHIRRVYMPIFDFLAVVAGIAAVEYSIPALDDLFTPAIADAVGYLFALSGLASLAGIAFPAAWALEIWAKSVLAGLLLAYALSIGALLALFHDVDRGFVAVIALMATLPFFMRLSVLGEEKRIREAKARAAAAVLAALQDGDPA